MKIFLSIMLFMNLTLAQEMLPVTKESPEKVQAYASGVCSIGVTPTGTNCCTGFRISEDYIMTNFHCLACVHQFFRLLVQATPRFMEPSTFLYSFPSQDPVYLELVKNRLRLSLGTEDNFEKFFLPNNDKEFKDLMNVYPDNFTRINFRNHIDQSQDSLEGVHDILGIVALNLSLDYAVLRVSSMQDVMVLKPSDKKIRRHQSLAIMGHPSQGPWPHKKVYDISSECRVIDPKYENSGNRTSVFAHLCATAPGSSGSPIMDLESGSIVGLHWGARTQENVRMGIQMKSILKDLQENWPEVIVE